jgi:maltose O-acetyltransferase
MSRSGAKLLGRLVQWARILWYRCLSTGRVVNHGARFVQPVLVSGRGEVVLGRCQLGVSPSPHLFSGYIHLEARDDTARIVIDDGACLNNNVCLIAERSSITVGADALIGVGVSVYDSDFHSLDPRRRTSGDHACAPVVIGRNVFLGSHVTVLKGVTIGEDSVVGSGSVVTRDVPASVRAGGVPCRVLGPLPGPTTVKA